MVFALESRPMIRPSPQGPAAPPAPNEIRAGEHPKADSPSRQLGAMPGLQCASIDAARLLSALTTAARSNCSRIARWCLPWNLDR
jgi:hypothetical protein